SSIRAGGGLEVRQPGRVSRPHGWSSRRTRFPLSTILFAVESQLSAAPDESAKIVTRWFGRFFPAIAVAATAQQSATAASSARERPTGLDSRRRSGGWEEDLGPQNDLERGAEAGGAADAEATVDRRRASADVPQSLPGRGGLGREAFTVVLDDDEPLARGAPPDHDLGAGR